MKPPAEKKDPTALSMQSGMSSSLVETSEDEAAKQKEAEKAAKAAKKGLSSKELDMDVDVVIEETETYTLLHLPSQVVASTTSGDTKNEEIAEVQAASERYEIFLENKKGSDNYTERGSQTMNLTQKTREVSHKGFGLENKEIQASWWDIYDSQQQKVVTEAERMKSEYYAMIDEIMTERLKTPGCMIDAEALAAEDSKKAFESMQAAQSKLMNSAIEGSQGGSQKRSGKGSSK